MNIKFIISIVLLFYTQIFSQENNIVAKVGEKKITAKEFKYRYELTPQINRKHKDIKKSKEEFLFTLIAEDLFAQEAGELGFDTLKDFRATYIPLEKMYVRDALYKQVIKNKVKIDKKQLFEGLKFASKKLFVDYIFTTDGKKIKKAYKLLTSNTNFDSLVTLLDNDIEYVNKPYEVTFGKMNIEAERAVFNLKQNEITKPIKSEEGWYIFRLLKEEPVPYKSITQKESLVKKTVTSRIEDSIYQNYMQSFFKGKHITTSGTLFWYLAENLQKIISEIKEKNNLKEGEKIVIAPKDFIKLQKSLNADSLKKIFIQIPDNPVTLEDFLNDFMFEGFFTFTTEPKVISAQLSSRVKRQIELELLASEGYKKGLESLPEVKKETEIWKNNYLATLYRRNFINKEKLSDEDLKNYLLKNTNGTIKETEVNVIEITTNSLEEIEKILKQEQNGTDFEELAKKYKNNNKIESGFFPVSENKEIGTIAETMNAGDIYGPVKTNNGYTVFKLIEKKESNFSTKISQLDDDTKRKIKYRKILERLEDKTAELAEKYKITLDEKLLNSIELINAQMVVIRYMGFGGKIPAFPSVIPFYKWKEKWEQKKKESL